MSSSSATVEWRGQYDSLKAAISASRVSTGTASGARATEAEVAQLQARAQALGAKLKVLASAPVEHDISASELSRRQVLVENLKTQIQRLQLGLLTATAPPSSSINTTETASATFSVAPASFSKKELIKRQDELITDIGAGVDRLRASALNIHEETTLHTRLLDDFDTDVSIATAALQAEATRASKIKERTQMFRLYICLAFEVVILFILLIAWGMH